MATPVLQVRNLTTRFKTERGVVTAVDNISFEVAAGETLAIVGESGSGKSVTSMSILRLIPSPPGRIENGEILFDGKDLLKLNEDEMRAIRGDRIAMIFQDSMSSLNPSITIGKQIAEPITLHRNASWKEAYEKARDLLSMVQIPDAQEPPLGVPAPVLGRHAPALDDRHGPGLPAQADHRRRTHHRPGRDGAGPDPGPAQGPDPKGPDLHDPDHARHGRGGPLRRPRGGDVRRAHRRARPGARDLQPAPAHPYTQGLLASIPRIDSDPSQPLPAIEGMPPDLSALPVGCAFAPRCPKATRECEAPDRPCFQGERRPPEGLLQHLIAAVSNPITSKPWKTFSKLKICRFISR
jgi:oligopeptide transport system ATP-binding protein